MLLSENFNFSIMTLPGLSCILMGTSYKNKLLSYTLGPLFVYFMIMVPCILANVFFSQKTLSEKPWKSRYENARKSMMNNICFFSFLIYPMVSMAVLKGLHCKDFGPPVGSLLITDVSVVCPYAENGDRFLYWYTFCFVFVYPLGLPVLLWLLLKAYKVPQMANKKILESGLTVMIQMYMDETCATPLKTLAAILWSEEKMLTYFKLICNEQGWIVLEDLKQVDTKDRHRKFKELFVAVLTHMEVTQDMDYHKFSMLVEKLQHKVSQAAREFKGPDTSMDMLTSTQLRLLIKHQFKCDRGEAEEEEFSLMDAIKTEDGDENSKSQSRKNEAEDVFQAMEAGGNDGNAPEDQDAPHNKYQSFKDFKRAMNAVEDPPGGKKKRLSKKERDKLGVEERADELEKEELRHELTQRIMKLVKIGVLALPPMAWDGEDEDEQRAVREIGSLFRAYRPTAWKFELFETFRKLLMVAMLLFIYEGKPLQVAIGFIITFIVIMYVQQGQPYSTTQLNTMAVFSFIGQLATLFYGLLAMANDGDPDIDPDGIDQVLMQYLVAFINLFVVFLPFMEMEGLAAIPVAIIGFLLCCVAPMLHFLGLKKRDEEEEVEPEPVVYNSDDELDDMASDDPYLAAFAALRSKEARRLFDKFDADSTGTLSSEELFQALSRCGYSGERILEIMQDVDEDGSGEISYAEWDTYFTGSSKSPTHRASSAQPGAPRELSSDVNVEHPVVMNSIQDTESREMGAIPVSHHVEATSQHHKQLAIAQQQQSLEVLQGLTANIEERTAKQKGAISDECKRFRAQLKTSKRLQEQREGGGDFWMPSESEMQAEATHSPRLDVATVSRLPHALGQSALESIAAGVGDHLRVPTAHRMIPATGAQFPEPAAALGYVSQRIEPNEVLSSFAVQCTVQGDLVLSKQARASSGASSHVDSQIDRDEVEDRILAGGGTLFPLDSRPARAVDMAAVQAVAQQRKMVEEKIKTVQAELAALRSKSARSNEKPAASRATSHAEDSSQS